MPAEADAQVDRALILTKLSRLSQYLGYLNSLQPSSLEEFKGDFRISGATQKRPGRHCYIGYSKVKLRR